MKYENCNKIIKVYIIPCDYAITKYLGAIQI